MLKSLQALTLAAGVLCTSPSFAQIDSSSLLANYDSKPSQVISLKEAAGNLSGVVFNYDTQTYFVIQNNSYQFVEYDKTFSKALRIIKLLNLPDKDTEDIAYLGNDQYAISMESNAILIFTLRAGQTSVDVSSKLADVQLLTLTGPNKDNKGIEGLCFTKNGGNGAGVFYAVQEDRPKRVFRIPRPTDMNDIKRSRKLSYSEPFDVDKIFKHVMSDLSGCTYSDQYDHLLVLSHESSRLMEINKAGAVVKSMDLSRSAATQYEGVTIGAEGELILASEPDKIVVFKPKK